MQGCDFILFLDHRIVTEDIIRYFHQFNIEVQIQKNFDQLQLDEKPLAILINILLLQNNMQALKKLYNLFDVPLIIITDRPDEELCIRALEFGADDFLVHPVYPRELHARISAINRRVISQPISQTKLKEHKIYKFEEWELYPAARQIFNTKNNQEMFLSSGEFDLLYLFLQMPQQILDREYLVNTTKNADLHPLDRRIDVQISRLRQKIEEDGKNPKMIKTIRNGGYIFVADVQVELFTS